MIRQDATLRVDQVKLPYVELVKCLQQSIINVLVRNYNISPSEAYDRWQAAIAVKDETIAQIIDDEAGNTLTAASTVEKDVRSKIKYTDNKEAAECVGKVIAERAKAKGIEEVVFDRGGFVYHGKIQALADAAREAGLKF